MLSFQNIYERLQNQTGDDSSAQLTIFKQDINLTQHAMIGNHPWKFLEFTADITTVADTGSYDLPASVRKIVSAVVLDSDGEVDQNPNPIEDPLFYEELLRRKSGSSDITQYFYLEGSSTLKIWPNFDTAGRTIRIRGRKNVVDMTRADYTTGTIVSITSGAKALVGSGTSWLGRKPLGNQAIRIDETTGDLRWYPINAIGSDTAITLQVPYLGTTIAAGTETYKIGEMPIVPEAYQMALVYRPLALYYMKIENSSMANMYWDLYDGGYEMGKIRRPAGVVGQMIKEQFGMLDAAYFPSQRGESNLSAEYLSKDTSSTLG
jgi:hypothetical protein